MTAYADRAYADPPFASALARKQSVATNRTLFTGLDIAGIIAVVLMSLGPLTAYSFGV